MFDGPFAWIMIIVALLLIFGGGKRLPEIGKGLGSFVREFKKAQKDDEPAEPKALNGADATPKLGESKDKDQAGKNA